MELFKFKGTIVDRASDRVCSAKTYRLTMERSSMLSDEEQARYRRSQIRMVMGEVIELWMLDIETHGRRADDFLFFIEPSCVLRTDAFDVDVANSCF